MSSLTTEQIILLIIFVGIPLARIVLRRLRSQHPVTASPVVRAETDELDEEDVPFAVPAPARPSPPKRAAVRKPPPEPVTAKATRANRRRAPSPPPLLTALPQPAAASARLVLRGGKPGLHQAVVLMTIIGPPRSLDPYTTNTSS